MPLTRSWNNGDEIYRFGTTDDIGDIAQMLDDPEVARYLWFTPLPPEGADQYFRPLFENQTRALDNDELPTTAVFTVFDQEQHFLGQGGVVAVAGSPDGYEIGFQLSRKAWGKGVGTRLSRFLCAYAINKLDAYRIEGACLAGNIASRRLLEKIGLVLEGTRKGYRLKDERHDELLFAELTSNLDRELIDNEARRAGLI